MGHTEADSPFEVGSWDGRLSRTVKLSRSQMVYFLLLVSRQELMCNGKTDAALAMTERIKAMEVFDVVSPDEIASLLIDSIGFADKHDTWLGSYPEAPQPSY